QERLWFLDRLEGGSASYNIPAAVRLAGALDVDALERALGEIVRRHESLRTVFAEVDGSPVQVIAPFAGFALPVEDLSALSEADRKAAVEQRAGEEAARPFDLAAGPLFRAALFCVAPDDHVLVLAQHHVVTDGWSMGVLFRELSALYAALVTGEPSPLAPLPVQYADYAVWQRGWLAGETLERQVAFWRERLAGAPPVLDLPLDRPRPPVQATRGAEHAFLLSPELRRGLEALSRKEGATLFMTLLAAWQLLLAKYAGEEDVTVGTPIAGRTHEATEDVVGMFVNTLALRTDLSSDPSFRELLGRVRRGTLDAYAHQDLPFEKLVEELAPERSLGHHPVFQVFFALQNAPVGGLELPGLSAEPLDAGAGITKFDLSLGMGEAGEGLGGALGYAADLFDAATIERMAGHFRVLLERIAADPDARLSALSLLDADEADAVVRGWNRTGRVLPGGAVHELFAAQAAATPDAVAVAFGSGRVTYAELDARAEEVASRLRAHGADPESRVGICLERGPAMLAAVLGVLKAGAAYVPLDPAYPAERIRFVAADAGLSVLLTESSLVDTLPVAGIPVLTVDADAGKHDDATEEDALSHSRTFALSHSPSPDNAAYLIYTSGSTGTPKGVVVEHRGLANTLLASREEFGFESGDVAAVLASYAFDIWGFEALVPLLAGGSVRVVPRDDVVDAQRLVAELEGVSVLHAVPALMRQVAAEVRASGRGTLPRLRLAFVGGDAVPPDLLDEMREVFPAAQVRVLYGPTEATVLASSHRVAAGERVERSLLGAPLGNVRAYVLDAHGEPVPPGIAGELYVGGRGVARGYQGRPELTAEKFVPDPFSGEAGARLYRTGDRARRLADGTLEFLGRTDAQVKIRGFRIEPGEVEAVLAAHPSVREAAVVAREDEPGELRLVGYAAPDPEAPPVSAGELRAWIRERLPEHMVPAAVLLLEALPLSPTGKVDRRALPAPERPLAELAGEMGMQRTPTEEVVAAVWADVLRLPRVGAAENFFALGGHSLLATQVESRLRAAFRVDVPVRALFEAPTVAGLAERVDAAVRAGQGMAVPPLARAERDGPLPLSFAQERLWVIDRMDPGGSAYNMPFTLRLRGELDPGALRAALDALVERHESLRTVFPASGGRPVQVVHPAQGAPFRWEPLDGTPDAEREARAL
ncbi:MAG TPA: amino acid adenylation domain-containing protein, partial [Longimicrobiaceae bacterium]|nr:amino acid adenylation domain-containing protein [Longimicrobiaceae bacterium]